MKLEITPGLEKEISDKVAESIKYAYFGSVADAINKAITEELTKSGTLDRIVQGVFDRIVLSEQEYIDSIGVQIKESLLKVTGTIANETIKKVEEKVKSYGFIKIADRY